jgi:hypothetical protein
MACGFTRVSYKSQNDLHISAQIPRYNAQGNLMLTWSEESICICVPCEAYDLKFPLQRVNANLSLKRRNLRDFCDWKNWRKIGKRGKTAIPLAQGSCCSISPRGTWRHGGENLGLVFWWYSSTSAVWCFQCCCSASRG